MRNNNINTKSKSIINSCDNHNNFPIHIQKIPEQYIISYRGKAIRLAILPSLLIFSLARSVLRLFGAHPHLAPGSPLSAVRAKLHENVSYQSTNRSAFEGFPPWNEIWATIYHTCFKLKLMNWIIHRMKRRADSEEAKYPQNRSNSQESRRRVGMRTRETMEKLAKLKDFLGKRMMTMIKSEKWH